MYTQGRKTEKTFLLQILSKMTVFTSLCLILFLVASAGCGKLSKEKSIDDIKKDFEQAFLKQSSDLLMINGELSGNNTVVDYKIEKRRTSQDDKTDTIYGTAYFDVDNGSARAIIGNTMYYSLYNEGWLLDNLEVKTFDLVPLIGSNLSNETILEWLNGKGYTNVSDLVVYDHITDLENRTDTYCLTATDTHRLVTTHLDVKMTVGYAVFTGWDVQSARLSGQIDDSWAISGWYDRTDGSGYVSDIFYYIDAPYEDLTLYAGKADAVRVEYGGTSEYYCIMDIHGISLKDWILECAGYILNGSRYYTDMKTGYRAKMDNADWESVKFVLLPADHRGSFFVTKDRIYCYLNHLYEDKHNRVHYFTFDDFLEPF